MCLTGVNVRKFTFLQLHIAWLIMKDTFSAKYSFDKFFSVEICYSKLCLSVSCFIHVQKKEFLTASKRVHYVCKLYYETNSIERHLIFTKSSYCQRNQTCNVWSIKRETLFYEGNM